MDVNKRHTLVLYLIASFSCSVLCCVTSNEGDPTTVLCDSGSFSNFLEWYSPSLRTRQVAKCYPNNMTCEVSDPALFSANLTRSGAGLFRSSMTVLSSARDGRSGSADGHTLWSCGVDGALVSECNASVVARPSTPVCDKPELVGLDSDPEVKVTCRTDRVFPEAGCDIYVWKDQRTTFKVEEPVSYEHHSSGSDPTYYSTSCTISKSVTSLGPGSYHFRVLMYPGVTSEGDHTVQSSDTETVNMTNPRAVLGPDCAQNGGYVMSGSPATCICLRYDAGYLPGTVGWRTSQGADTGDVSQSGDDTVLTVTTDDVGSVFTCRVQSPNGSSPDVQFAPKLAYGPTTVRTEMISGHSNPINLCTGSNVTLRIRCSTSKSDMAPEPLFSVKVNGDNFAQGQRASILQIDDLYLYELDISVTSGGQLEVTCIAENLYFPVLRATSALSVTVLEPPEYPPLAKVDGYFAVQDEVIPISRTQEIFEFDCQVEGGEPAVTMVTAACGSRSESEQGQKVIFRLDTSQEPDIVRCNCTGEHPSSCYHQVVRFTLNFTGTPTQGSSGTNNNRDETNDTSSQGEVSTTTDQNDSVSPENDSLNSNSSNSSSSSSSSSAAQQQQQQ
ncbi:uncharacterized protein LOC101860407 [Aplysia californica]|uniref:Uncharacterized protein LOC101860407 n=1 Tax=Aplysia californica TaxID=6500 RepID=A0ABM0ZYP4_APLCA|nr:uncharacterized protein LOC101860407 [Aplysia californica]